MKSKVLKEIIAGVAFLLVFTLLLSILTLVYYPKWKANTTHGQMAGFYREPKNSLDVILLGSCNMYTSFSPVLLYDEYGITSYGMTCPDEELSTSYYYLKDALKRQKPKVVVVEALFFTAPNDQKREKYNRFALDYMPLSLNKIQAAAALAGRESRFMQQYDETAADSLLTFMSYLFPLLRYHSRTDLSAEDLTFFLSDNVSNPNKGNYPFYSLPLNDAYHSDVDWVFNKAEINDTARTYFPMIQELCEENGIDLVVMKSPNYVRWGFDDTYTGVVREYVEGLGVDFVDCHAPEFNDFLPDDYSSDSYINIQGDKKLTHNVGGYLVDTYGLSPTPLTEEQRAAWDACVENYYAQAEENGMSITPGQISYITNKPDGSSICWNAFRDCGSYSVYRAEGRGEDFTKIADVDGTVFEDTDVVSGQGYTYYIVPRSGENAGHMSEPRYNIFVEMPAGFTMENENGGLRMNWEPVEGVDGYKLYRRSGDRYRFEGWDTTSDTTYLSTKVENGVLYYYSLTAFIEEDGVRYESEIEIARATPLAAPLITTAYTEDGKIMLQWEPMNGVDRIEVWRRSELRDEFELYDVIAGNRTDYTNANYLEAGRTYFYKFVAVADNYDVVAKSEESNTVCAIVAP